MPKPQMDQVYWNRISENYQSEVLSVFDNDMHGLVEERIASAGVDRPNGRAADLGCGVGRFTPSLADAFDSVDACDFSKVGIRKAKRRCHRCDNVAFHEVDLSSETLPFAPSDFVLCVNVLIMPSLSQRRKAWETVMGQVAEGGTLLLVAPSAESAQMEFLQMVEAQLKRGSSCRGAIQSSVEERASTMDLRLGVHQINGVRTKHYLKDELLRLFWESGLEVDEALKLRYRPKGHEITDTWDWLMVAKNKKRIP